jgi:hypothetical protein
MATVEQAAAKAAFLATPLGGEHSYSAYNNGEPVERTTWRSRQDITEYLLDALRDEQLIFAARTDNPHGVTLAQVLAADNTTIIPAAQIDPLIARKAYVDTRTTGTVNTLITASATIDEVVAARGIYATLQDRLDGLSGANIISDLFTSGTMVTQDFTGIIAPMSLAVTFTGGIYYDNGVETLAPAGYLFDSQVSATDVYLWVQPGGTLVESLSLTPSLGALVGVASVNNTEVLSWSPTSSLVVDRGLVVEGDVTITGEITNAGITLLTTDSHRHLRADCVQTGTANIFTLPISFTGAAEDVEVWRRGVELNPTSYVINMGLGNVTLLSGPFAFEPDEWVYMRWIERL